jgi:rubrerythrin
MDIIKFALKMEADGKKFYQDAASKAATKELKDIFIYLAEEEERHFKFFKMMDEGKIDAAGAALESGTALKDTRNVFVQLIEENKEERFGDDARAAWLEALEIEKKAVAMYSEEADKEADAGRKKLLTRIADEERNHVYLINNMLSFMSDPQGFADSQDFASFKSWEGR